VKQVLVLQNEQIRKRALYILEHLALDTVHEVVIKPYKVDRSREQNNLYWKWIGIMAPEFGNTTEELHDELRLQHLVGIYYGGEDREGYRAEYDQLVNSARRYQSDADAWNNRLLRNAILNITSTTKASVKEMSAYLRAVDQLAAEMEIHLPHPADRGLVEPVR